MKTIIRRYVLPSLVKAAFVLWRLNRKCGGRIVKSRKSQWRRQVLTVEVAVLHEIDRLILT